MRRTEVMRMNDIQGREKKTIISRIGLSRFFTLELLEEEIDEFGCEIDGEKWVRSNATLIHKRSLNAISSNQIFKNIVFLDEQGIIEREKDTHIYSFKINYDRLMEFAE